MENYRVKNGDSKASLSLDRVIQEETVQGWMKEEHLLYRRWKWVHKKVQVA
jgi:hypothetical protein